MGVVVAIDAGTTGVRSLAVDEQRPGLRHRLPRVHAALPPAGLGRARRRRDLATPCRPRSASCAPGSTSRSPPSASPTSARRWWPGDRRTGQPLHRAIVWQDRRTAERCDELAAAGHLPLVRQRTGLVLDPYFSATKLAWLLAEGGVRPGPTLPSARSTPGSLWNLTGGQAFVTDPSNASRTMLFDLAALAWDAELGELLGVPLAALAEVRPTSGRLGDDRRAAPARRPARRSAASSATSRAPCSARRASRRA